VTPLYPQKLALTSPTGGGRSVGIVRSRTKATEFSFRVTVNFHEGFLHSDQLRQLSCTSNFNPMAGKKKFALIGCYAVYIGSYGRFGTNYRYQLQGPKRSMTSHRGRCYEHRRH